MRASKRQYYYLWNIGCQMNKADAQRLAEALERRGYAPTGDPAQAAIMVLNTCVVRQSAQDRVTGRLSSLSSLKRAGPNRLLVVMGCFVGDPDQLAIEYPFVDLFAAPSDIVAVLDAVDVFSQAGDRCDQNVLEPVSPQPVSDMVPISYGCDHHCTYCVWMAPLCSHHA